MIDQILRRTVTSLAWVLAHLAVQAQDSIECSTTIPFQDQRGAMIFQVEIGGKSYPMLFDCGATMCVTPKLWKELGLEDESAERYSDSQGNIVTSRRAKLPPVYLEGQCYEGLTAMQLDIANIPGFSCYNIAGVVGPEVIGQKVWTLDFESLTVTISDSLTDIPVSSTIVPLVRRFNGQPWFHLSLASGDSILCCFDTGSNGSLNLSKEAARSLSAEPLSFVECGYTGTGGGGYGHPDTTLNVVTTNTVLIGRHFLCDVPVRLHSKPTNIMGTRVMRLFRIALDYRNNRIVFTPREDAVCQQDALLRGISFGYSDQHIIVASIRGTTNDDLPRVPIGAVVTAINGRRLPSPATPATLCDILASDDQKAKKLRLTIIDESGREKRVSINLKQKIKKQ